MNSSPVVKHRLASLAVLAAVAFTACGGGTGRPVLTDGPTQIPRPTGETTPPPPADLVARDAAGRYRISTPADWRVSQDAAGRVVATDASTRIAVWPFFTTEPSFDADGASAALAQWIATAAPSVTLTTVAPTADGVVARGRASSGDEALAFVRWAATDRGSAGLAGVVEAPDVRAAAPVAAAILGTFRPEGPPVEDTGPTLEFTNWRDPSEGAFSADVPSGWRVDGGVVRASLLVQSYLALTSPDEAIEVIMGDAFGYYVEPNSTLAYAGLGEGDTYTATDGSRWPIRSYRPGARFLTELFFPAAGLDVEVTQVTDRPDVAARIPTLGINAFAAGEVEYRLGDRIGQALIVTEQVSIPVGAAWHPFRLVLVTTPPERTAEAAQAVTRLVESFAVDPDWATMQQRLTAAQSAILTEQNATVSGIISDGYWGRQAVYDALSVRRERATLEVVDVTDGAGNEYRVDAGSDYYWVGPDGTIVGTAVAAAPEIDFRRLFELP